MNYFEFYNIPVGFVPDPVLLKKRYYENSKAYHPDYHTLADEAQQEEMLELATLNNDAYRTLSDPDRCMAYVLKIKGMLAEEGKQEPLPQEFLMEVMDINEALMALEFDFDPEQYAMVKRNVETLENGLKDKIRPVLDEFRDEPAQLQTVKDYYLKRKYLLRIKDNLSKFAGS